MLSSYVIPFLLNAVLDDSREPSYPEFLTVCFHALPVTAPRWLCSTCRIAVRPYACPAPRALYLPPPALPSPTGDHQFVRPTLHCGLNFINIAFQFNILLITETFKQHRVVRENAFLIWIAVGSRLEWVSTVWTPGWCRPRVCLVLGAWGGGGWGEGRRFKASVGKSWKLNGRICTKFRFWLLLGVEGRRIEQNRNWLFLSVVFYLLLVNIYYSFSHWHGWLDYQSFLLMLELYSECNFWKIFQNTFWSRYMFPSVNI